MNTSFFRSLFESLFFKTFMSSFRNPKMGLVWANILFEILVHFMGYFTMKNSQFFCAFSHTQFRLKKLQK